MRSINNEIVWKRFFIISFTVFEMNLIVREKMSIFDNLSKIYINFFFDMSIMILSLLSWWKFEITSLKCCWWSCITITKNLSSSSRVREKMSLLDLNFNESLLKKTRAIDRSLNKKVRLDLFLTTKNWMKSIFWNTWSCDITKVSKCSNIEFEKKSILSQMFVHWTRHANFIWITTRKRILWSKVMIRHSRMITLTSSRNSKSIENDFFSSEFLQFQRLFDSKSFQFSVFSIQSSFNQ